MACTVAPSPVSVLLVAEPLGSWREIVIGVVVLVILLLVSAVILCVVLSR